MSLKLPVFLGLFLALAACGSGKSLVEMEEELLKEDVERRKNAISQAVGVYLGELSNSEKVIGPAELEVRLRPLPTNNPSIPEYTLSGSIRTLPTEERPNGLMVARFIRGSYKSEDGMLSLTSDTGHDASGFIRRGLVRVDLMTLHRPDLFFEGELVSSDDDNESMTANR